MRWRTYKNHTKVLADDFLNHLCDGEPYMLTIRQDIKFLNHLCDGELQINVKSLVDIFLNHLCDGEPLQEKSFFYV